MPEYLAPGVFVEEVSFRPKTIEGVSTTTAGFVGPTRFGPTEGEPELLTSFSDFERIYGGIARLEYQDAGTSHNYMAHAVRAFFEEGGRRLHVSRVFEQGTDDGIAEAALVSSPPEQVMLQARYPGNAGNFSATFVLRAGDNILDVDPIDPADTSANPAGRLVLRGVAAADTVLVTDQSPPTLSAYTVAREIDDSGLTVYRLTAAGGSTPIDLDDLPAGSEVRRLTVSVIVTPTGEFEDESAWEGLTFHDPHRDALTVYFSASPASRTAALTLPLVITSALDGASIAELMMEQGNLLDGSPVADSLLDDQVGDNARSFRLRLSGGNDGNRPGAAQYEGDDNGGVKSGLMALEDIEEIFSVAAPGSTFDMQNGYGPDASAITRLLISHCERMRYRVAILDSGDGQGLTDVRAHRAGIDSTRAALYYPWVTSLDPVTESEIQLPPSGFMAGIYARNDIQFGVHKSPANEVVRLAAGFEILLNKAQQEALNPEGINCLRFFEGRGYRVWGARTATSDPEWKYLNVRRYFAFLERSIEKGTQWAVFENNGPELWANIRSTVEDFLYNEFRSGHLLGSKPAEAYFVRCDRSTMTQNDLDNGRLICLVGVAPLRPAEFVIFRIGQKTADAQA